MQFPITIGLHRSRLLDTLIAVMALVASASSIAFPISTGYQAALLSVVWLIAALAWHHASSDIRQIRLERNGKLSVKRHLADEFLRVSLQSGGTVHPWLIVLHFSDESGNTDKLIATVDSINPQNFRILRVFLRWQAKFSDQSGV